MKCWLIGLVGLILGINSVESAAIIGIDFGTKFIKVASVQPGKAFDIVENENSKRKTENVMGIQNDGRLYGSDAVGLASRYPKNVFLRSRDLLGVKKNSPEVEHLKELDIIYDIIDDEETGGFKVAIGSGSEKEYQFYPEDVVGMILAYVRRFSSAHIDEDVVDCVITVPPFFTQVQREALLNAASIAGFNVLTLIDENVAAAVQHGIYTEFTNSSHKVLVYNMGSASTKVTLFNFWGKPGVGKNSKANTQIEVLSKAWDKQLGGDMFDDVVIDKIVKEFDEKNYKGKDQTVRDSRRAMERIRKQANKVKTVLSANNEIPISIESLNEGIDYRSHITRSEFEAKSKAFLDRVLDPIKKVMEESETKVEDLHAVELIGGGIRVPKLKEILAGYFGDKELGNHLNGDEAKAFGAVFVGANMSKAFRVRPVGLTDVTGEAVVVKLAEAIPNTESEDGPWEKDAVLFNASSPLNARKIVSFRFEKDIICTLLRKSADGTTTTFADYKVTGVEDAIEKYGNFGKAKISLTYLLSSNDTVALQKADAIFVEEIPAEDDEDENDEEKTTEDDATKAEKDGEEKKDTTDDDEKKDIANDEEKKDTNDDEEKKDTTDDEEKKDTNDDEGKKEEKKKKKKKKKGPTKKTHRFPLKITRTDTSLDLKPLSGEKIASSKALLSEWEQKEADQRLHQAEKNKVESFVFGSRDKIRTHEEKVDKVLPEDDKDKLFEDLMDLEDWLDDDGADAPISEYKSRVSEIDKRIKKIFRRVDELDQRPATIKASRKVVIAIKTQMEGHWTKERPWISSAEKEYITEKLDEFLSWLDGKVAEQDAISLQQAPVLTSGDIALRMEPIHQLVEAALKKPMPKPPKKKKEKKKNETKTDDSTTKEEEDDDKDKTTTDDEDASKKDEDASDEKDEL